MPRPPAARPDTIRRHNLGLLLEQIHRDGPLTRAELTQRLGVNRSTIAALSAELIELGWLEEQLPTGAMSRAGRPSFVVAPRQDGPYVVAVDVNVERVVAAAVGLAGRVLCRTQTSILPGQTSPAQTAQIVADLTDALVTPLGRRPAMVGVGVPGAVTRTEQRVVFAPNLAWHDTPFRALVADRLTAAGLCADVVVANDANLAALAESVRGAARGYGDVAYLLGRVGVGAGLVVEGRALAGAFGLAGEAGHIVLDPAGPPCHCGNRGCVEMFIGDTALLRAASSRASTDTGWAGPDPTDARAVLAAAARGEPAARAGVVHVAAALGQVIVTLATLLDPRMVVLGGSLGQVYRLAQDVVHQGIESTAPHLRQRDIAVVAGILGEDATLLGAAELAFSALTADPVTASGRPADRDAG